MGLFEETALESLIAAGCATCGSHKLVFRTYVDGLLPIMGGDPIKSITWAYNGEKFVDGIYDITCGACAASLFSASACPRCHADGGLAVALESENRWPVPEACPRCEAPELRYLAFFPAKVVYEGRRADKARTTTELHDPGCHGYRVECKSCGPLDELFDHCPLCTAPAPLRPRRT